MTLKLDPKTHITRNIFKIPLRYRSNNRNINVAQTVRHYYVIMDKSIFDG